MGLIDVRKLQNLQALRAVAATAVVMAHLGALGARFPAVGTEFGVYGVDIFFVLSGFIMSYVTRSSWGRPGSFLVHRALRIYPLWWICLIIAAPWISRYLFQAPDMYFGYVARSWFLWPAISPRGDLLPLLVPGWTLAYEAAFYLFFAALMPFDRRGLVVKVLLVFGAAWACSSLLPSGSAEQRFLANPIYFEFALGALVADMHARDFLNARWISVTCLVAFALVIVAVVSKMNPDGVWRFAICGVPAAAVLMLALYMESRGRFAPTWLVFLGEASYSLYLTHTMTISRLQAFFSGWFGLLAIALLCLLVGIIVHLCVERPLLWAARWLRHEAVPARS